MSALIVILQFIFGAQKPAWKVRRRRLFRRWSRVALWLMNVELTVKGTAPQPPCLLVSNHLGYLDIMVYAAVTDATFVSKQEVAHWPILGPVVRVLGTIFVDRTKRKDVARVNCLINQSLESGSAVIVFAEGTSTNGDDVLPLHPSLLSPAEGGRYPVRYARLAYSTTSGDPDAGTAVCWWGDSEFVSHAWGLFQVRKVHALLHFGSDSVQSDNRKELARMLHQRIRSLPVSLR